MKKKLLKLQIKEIISLMLYSFFNFVLYVNLEHYYIIHIKNQHQVLPLKKTFYNNQLTLYY